MTMNSSQTALPKLTIWPNARSSRRMIATLTKLFVTRIVASSFSELSVSAHTLLSRRVPLVRTVLSSSGESEKNAVSEAETKPETARRSRAATIPMTDPTVGRLNVTPAATPADANVIKVSIILPGYVQNGSPESEGCCGGCGACTGCTAGGTGGTGAVSAGLACWVRLVSISMLSTKISVT